MPKAKFKLSKKHESLIDICVSIPSLNEITMSDFSNRTIVSHRENVEDSLLSTIDIISKGTQYESTCNEIIEKARSIFEHYDSKN